MVPSHNTDNESVIINTVNEEKTLYKIHTNRMKALKENSLNWNKGFLLKGKNRKKESQEMKSSSSPCTMGNGQYNVVLLIRDNMLIIAFIYLFIISI